jgi:hypothetical protein
MTKGEQRRRREQRQKNAYFQVLRRQMRERFYISFNCKGAWDPVTERHQKYAWPKLFLTADAAWTAIKALPVFANREANESRGRIVSCSVERVLLP